MYLQLVATISLILFIMLLLARILLEIKLRKKDTVYLNKNRELIKDSLLSTETLESELFEAGVSKSSIYKVDNALSNVVSKYSISDDGNSKNLIINYNINRSTTDLNIYVYSKKGRLISVYCVHDDLNKQYSNIIKLPKKTNGVNLELALEKPSSKKVEKLYKRFPLFDSVIFFLGLVYIAYLTISVAGGRMYPPYLREKGLLVAVLLVVGLTILYYFILQKIYRKKYLSLEGR